MLTLLSEVGGLLVILIYLNHLLHKLFFIPVESLSFFFAMQEVCDEPENWIEDDGRLRQYFQLQLYRLFGF